MTTATEIKVGDRTVRVGDFFFADWGYDQTNINFYRVVAVTAKCVKVQEWTSQRFSDDHNGAVQVVPGFEPRTHAKWEGRERVGEVPAPIETKRLQTGYDGRPRLAWKSYADLYLWDCAPKYQTALGYGH